MNDKNEINTISCQEIFMCAFSDFQLTNCGLQDTVISSTMCGFSNEVKYFGVMINSSLKTTIDIKKQKLVNFIVNVNLLIHNFWYCIDNVKVYLFQDHFTSIYCCQQKINSSKGSLKNTQNKLIYFCFA